MPWNPIAPPTYFSNLPQIQNPTQQAPDGGMELNALANSAVQRQGEQTTNQQQQIALQQQQMDLQDQQTFKNLYRQNNGDMVKTLGAAAQAGVGPRTLMPIQTAVQAFQTGQAKLTQDKLDIQNSQNEGMLGLLAPVEKIQDPTAQKQAYDTAMQTALSKGYLTQGDIAQHPYVDRNGVTSYALGLQTVKSLNADAAQRQAAARQTAADAAKAKEDAELPGQQADAAQKIKALAASDLSATSNPAAYDARRDQFIHDGGSPGVFPPSRAVYDPNGQWLPGQQAIVNRSGMTAEQRTQADQAAANAKQAAVPKTDAELAAAATYDPNATPQQNANAALKRNDQSKIASRLVTNNTFAIPGLPASGQAASQLSGQPYLDSLPGATAAQVKAIAEGRAVLPSATSRATAAQQLRAAVFQYDPSYSDQRGQVRKAFTTGTDGRNIGNLNTAVIHMDALGDLAKSMDNGSFQPGNALYNRAATMFGGSAPTNVEGLRQAVAGEMDQALHGTSTIEGRNAILSTIPVKSSPAQMAGIIETNLRTMGQKLGTYQGRYQQQIPGDSVWSPVLPSAQQVFTKHGVSAPGPNTVPGPAPITVTDPRGTVHTFPNQAAAITFKKSAGIQ